MFRNAYAEMSDSFADIGNYHSQIDIFGQMLLFTGSLNPNLLDSLLLHLKTTPNLQEGTRLERNANMFDRSFKEACPNYGI